MTLPRHWFLPASMICAVLASLLFLPGLHGGFIFDDGSNIVENQAVHVTTLDATTLQQAAFGMQPGGFTRVLPTLSFAVDYWRGNGLNPATFKATNIAIHALTTLVLAWFFRFLFTASGEARQRAGLEALALACAWAIHPLQTSSVLYVVQRMQTMCTLFLLLALLAYLKARQAQIDGRSGRMGWLLTMLFWVMAGGCKEDAILLPVYTLAIELTVLRFQAVDRNLARRLRKSYLYATLTGIGIFLLVVVPHYWTWTAYPGRDFSSYERLLTEARVLCMYLWEILLPLPSHMPFYYDWLQPSRGLLQPWTTLPAILLLLALLGLAWRLRTQRPVFALGVFLFLAGHFMASNVMNLELAVEHRNQFPLVGAVLVVGDLFALASQQLRIRHATEMAICVILLALLGSSALIRNRIWGNPRDLVHKTTEFAPHSARAWNSECLYWYNLGGGGVPENPYRDKAISICGKGAVAAPYSLTIVTNLLVFKSLRGTATPTDWSLYLDRLQHVTLTPENNQSIWTIIDNVRAGTPLDETGVLKAIDIASSRGQFQFGGDAAIGYFILSWTHQPDRALPYFERYIQGAPANDALAIEIVDELKRRGHEAWAEKLGVLRRSEVQSRGIGPKHE